MLGTVMDVALRGPCASYTTPAIGSIYELSRHVQAFHMFLSSSPAFTARAAAVVLLLADPAPGEAFEKRIQEAADFQHQCREMVVQLQATERPTNSVKINRERYEAYVRCIYIYGKKQMPMLPMPMISALWDVVDAYRSIVLEQESKTYLAILDHRCHSLVASRF